MYIHFSPKIPIFIFICVFSASVSVRGGTTNVGLPYGFDYSELSIISSITTGNIFPILRLPASPLGLRPSLAHSLIFSKDLIWIIIIGIFLLLTIYFYKHSLLQSKKIVDLEADNKRLLERRKQAKKKAKHNAECLSTLSHEIRTPLSSSKGIIQLLRDSNLDREQMEYVKALKFSSDYLISLAENILQLYKLSVKKTTLEEQSFRLKEVVTQVVNLLDSSARANNTKIHLEYDRGIPLEVLGDDTKLSQILINLLSNAIQHTKNGDVWVRVLAQDMTDDTMEIKMEIRDTGTGIPKEEHQLIFEPFGQGSHSNRKDKTGFGLGLAIVKMLLENMGSQIHLESTPGKGTRFWFTLNFKYVSAIRKRMEDKKTQARTKLLAGKTVLVVEDDLISQMITKKLLQREHMKCIVVDNGERAVEYTKERKLDLVLMDLSIKGISGLEAAEEIRKSNPAIPIVALTAADIGEKWTAMEKAGFTNVIHKPFKMKYFLDKIYRTVQTHASKKSCCSH